MQPGQPRPSVPIVYAVVTGVDLPFRDVILLLIKVLIAQLVIAVVVGLLFLVVGVVVGAVYLR